MGNFGKCTADPPLIHIQNNSDLIIYHISDIKVCDPGTYLMGKCNRCYCSDDGLTAWCEFGVCLPEIPANRSSASVEDSTKIYEPGEIYKSDCIQCKCLPDGYTLDCTPDSCIPAGRNHSIVETSESPLIFCQPGKSHRSNCNDCTCSANGTTASCTLKNCSSENHLRKRRQISGPSCYPNLQFKRGCQDCTCGFYGLECSMSCEDGGVPECLPNGFSKSVADTAEREVTIMRYSVYTEGYPQFWTVCSFPQPDKITFQPKLQQYQRWPEPEDC